MRHAGWPYSTECGDRTARGTLARQTVLPGADSTSIRPPCSSVTIRQAVSSPSPTGSDILAAGIGTWPLERGPFLLETSVPGVFAAGDIRHGSGKGVATTVGDGAMIVMSVWQDRATNVG